MHIDHCRMLHLTARNLVALKQPQQSRSSYIVLHCLY